MGKITNTCMVLVVLAVVQSSFATIRLIKPLPLPCKCAYVHEQTKFCNAQYVYLVEVNSICTTKHEIKYGCTIKQKLKVPDCCKDKNCKVKKDIHVDIISPVVCPVILQLGKVYVISGTVDKHVYRTACCGQIAIVWDKLNKVQKKLYQTVYKSNCACKIEVCKDPKHGKNTKCSGCAKRKTESSCVLGSKECQLHKNDWCARTENKCCEWVSKEKEVKIHSEQNYSNGQSSSEEDHSRLGDISDDQTNHGEGVKESWVEDNSDHDSES